MRIQCGDGHEDKTRSRYEDKAWIWVVFLCKLSLNFENMSLYLIRQTSASTFHLT